MSFKNMRTALHVLGVGMFCAAALAVNGAQAGVHDWVYEEGRRVNGVAHTMKLRVAAERVGERAHHFTHGRAHGSASGGVSAGASAAPGESTRRGGTRGRSFSAVSGPSSSYRVDVLQREGSRTVLRKQVRAPEFWVEEMSLKISEAIVDAPMARPNPHSTKTDHCERWVKLSDEFGVRVFCDDGLVQNKYLMHLSASVSGVVSRVRKKY